MSSNFAFVRGENSGSDVVGKVESAGPGISQENGRQDKSDGRAEQIPTFFQMDSKSHEMVLF